MNQDIRESYDDKAAEGATAILQSDDEFDRADNEFEAAGAEEKAFDAAGAEEREARACSQRAGNLAGHATGTANELKEEKVQGSLPARVIPCCVPL